MKPVLCKMFQYYVHLAIAMVTGLFLLRFPAFMCALASY